jgi:hypothetical protein
MRNTLEMWAVVAAPLIVAAPLVLAAEPLRRVVAG